MDIAKQNEEDKQQLRIHFVLGRCEQQRYTRSCRLYENVLLKACSSEECGNVEVNLEKLAYVSSAGLRVLVAAHKRVKDKGRLEISHVCGTVLDVLEATGLSRVLNIIR